MHPYLRSRNRGALERRLTSHEGVSLAGLAELHSSGEYDQINGFHPISAHLETILTLSDDWYWVTHDCVRDKYVVYSILVGTHVCIPGEFVRPISAREMISNMAATEKYKYVTAERSHEGIDINRLGKIFERQMQEHAEVFYPDQHPEAYAIQDLTNDDFYVFYDTASDEYLVVNRIEEDEDNPDSNDECYVRVAGQEARPASAREALKTIAEQTSSQEK